ncbi:T9SS type A sorting domain-containing protein [Croceimicrobium hydrocarbonivorans]|uniref:T9SS type A sorting domain-containing protein n=1 Tax=Croceimicrobium hydrocarbonivorans TaxID=2761580 RepID=A0A7H0VF16_9FLAO|nr:T9SS type A sorting domain-containing protein [Croceimicrobium hydrocarbonivorans]QNR24314.1 T9SS type A sorting domain-containing protein [Croceimicrobium hydrocarbonivorans]
MKKIYFFALILLLGPGLSAQYYRQYFHGADTSVYNSVFAIIDSNSSWQIGAPSKNFFQQAATQPNAIVTDTLNSYPINDSSTFYFKVPIWAPVGILAIEWMQALDFEDSIDGGILEFRYTDTSAWESAFNNPYVYNFFGFDNSNVATLPNGELAFTGTRDMHNVWLCLDMSWLSQFSTDTIEVRYRILSDSVDTQQDGWLLDNFNVHITGIHTINEVDQGEFMTASPNPTVGPIKLNARKTGQVQYIESIELLDLSGKVVQSWSKSPTKFDIDISGQKAGVYILRVKSNIKKEEFRIMLQP